MEFPEDTKIITPERMQAIYGTDNYEWNHYKLPTGQVYDFLKQEVFMKRFLDTLYMATKDNETINNFLLYQRITLESSRIRTNLWTIH